MNNLIKTSTNVNKPHRISDGDGFDDVPFLAYDAVQGQWIQNDSIENDK